MDIEVDNEVMVGDVIELCTTRVPPEVILILSLVYAFTPLVKNTKSLPVVALPINVLPLE